MKVYNLVCIHGHAFEGWFSSQEDYRGQLESQLLRCPMCETAAVEPRPSAPRLNLGHGRGDEDSASATVSARVPCGGRSAIEERSGATPRLQPQAGVEALWMHAVRQVLAQTEDVGSAFTERAKRMHYGEEPEKPIRGQASPEQAQELREEGIEVLAIPIPPGLAGPMQ
jgi:hypothetical protein